VYEYAATIDRIIDGDTLHTTLDLGCHVRTRVIIRLAGLNAPEKATAEGRDAMCWVGLWMAQHPGPYVVNTQKDRQEKYGRWLGTITAADGHCLNDDLLAAGHALPYPA